MLIFDEQRRSDSPFVERIWRCHNEGSDPFLSIAESRSEIVVTKHQSKLTLTVNDKIVCRNFLIIVRRTRMLLYRLVASLEPYKGTLVLRHAIIKKDWTANYQIYTLSEGTTKGAKT